MVQLHEQQIVAAADAKQLAMQHAVRCILMALGEDVNREGLLDTPKRVAKALMAMTEGYRQDPAKLLSQALFHEPIIQAGADGLVLVRDIDFASLSQATLLPFYGRAHIAYLPAAGVVLGLSKLARLTKLCAKRLHSQASLGLQLLHVLQAALAPAGAVVVLQAAHLSYTGPQPPAQQLTAAASGCFAGAAALPQQQQQQQQQQPCKVAGVAGGSPASEPCLQEVLELLGLPLAAADVRLVPDAADPALLQQQPCGCSAAAAADGAGSCDCSWRRLEPSVLRGFSASAAAAADAAAAAGGAACSGDCGIDSPQAPVTPDPSENDDTDGSEPGSLDHHADDLAACCHQQQQQLDLAHQQQVQDLAAAAGGSRAASPAGSGAAGSMEAALKLLLGEAGVDVAAAAVQAAVRRHVLALLAATSGYHQEQPSRPLNSSSCWQQRRQQQQQQLAQGQPYEWHEHTVRFISQCEHHMLPFQGTAHICYLLPTASTSSSSACSVDGVDGGLQQQQQQQQPLSQGEAEQLVACFTRRLQVQERITAQVAGALEQLLAPAGVMVVVRAVHMCMVARGVENHAGSTVTRAALGAFASDAELRCRALRALNGSGSGGCCGGSGGGDHHQQQQVFSGLLR